MVRGWLVRLGLAFALLWMAVPGSAAWYEVRSRHFIVYSEGSPATIQKFAIDLERFDAGFRTALGMADVEGDAANPLTVFFVSNTSEVADLICRGQTGKDREACKNIAGFYSARISGSVAFVPRRAGNSFDDPRSILFHEYAHHLMLASSGAAYPAWYREGFAEFASYVRFDRDGEIHLAMPAQSRAYTLFALPPMRVPDVMTADLRKLTGEKRAIFYARSWLLTHYLTFAFARRDQLGNYLGQINKGVPAVDAATAAFGDLNVLDREVEAHLKRGKFQFLPVPVKPIPPESIRTRQLDAGEAAMMPVRIESTRGVNSDMALQVLADARRIAAPYADSPGAQIALTEAEFDADNIDAAEAAIDRALVKAPNEARAIVFKARIMMRRARDAIKDEEAAWREARKWLLKANRIETDAAWPLYLYYQSLLSVVQDAGHQAHR